MNSVIASGIRVFAISALLLTLLLTNSPRANATDIDMGVIANGSQVTGTLDYGDVLIWKFYAVAGTYGIVTSASTLADSADFKPRIQLTYPDDTNISTSTAWPGVRIQKNQTFNQSGWYKIKVDHYGPSGDTATARVNLVVTYQPYVVDSGASGGIVYSGTDVNGTIPIKGMNMDTWSVAVNAGDDVDVDMTSEAGKTARMLIYEPDGSYLKGQISTAPSLRITPSQSVTGTYLILTGNHYATYTDPNDYTLAIDGATGLPEIAKADGSTCLDGCIGGVAVGDPINVATGALFEQVTDYSTVGTNPLAFSRFYNSQSYMRGLHPTMMGENWRSTYDRYLRVQSSTAVAAEREDGRVVNFTYSGGSWNTDSDVDYVLYNSGSLWTLTDRNDTVESYTETGDIGKLDSITLRNGYEQSLSYSSSTGLLSSVTDTYGRAFGMSYSSMGVLTQLTTPDTLTLSYDYIAYSSQRVLETVGYNTSPATELTYLYENSSLPFALTGVTDENGDRYNTWAYDGAGRVTSAQRALGDGYTGVAYSSTGNHTVTGPLGIEETYYFSELQNMPKVTQIDRASNGSIAFASRGFTYDSNGYLATRTDWNGNLTAWTNNSEGNPTKIVYASNTLFAQTTDITYNSTWTNLPATITTNGVTESLSYDSSGNLTSRTLTDTTSQSTPYSTNGDLRTWAYTYVSSGLLASVQLPRTDVTAKTDYDYTDGVLTKITDALGYETDIISYKSGGLPLTVEDPNGVQTSFTYNVRNWLTGSTIYTSAGNYTTALTYDSAGNLTKQTLADGSYLSYDYDDAHRLTGMSNALSESQAISYNSAGLVTSRLWKNSGGTTKRDYAATYDALGRMLTSVGGEGQTTTYTYDANGNVLTITYPRGNKITQTWDVLDRLATSANDLGDQSTITYDSHNRVLSVTDPKSNVTSYVYNGFGDMIQLVSPDSGTDVLYYDSNGNVTQRIDGNSVTTNMTYDALDRIKTRTYPADSSLNVTYTYDQSGHGAGVGRLTSVSDAAGSLSMDWTQRGFLDEQTRTISGDDYTTEYAYQSAGRLASITYASSGWLVSYGYDDAGQIEFVSATEPGQSAVNLAANATYLPFGPLTGFTYGNGITHTRTYDEDYRVTGILDDAGASNVFYSSYGYDANSNITSILDNVASSLDQALLYDSADRLAYASGGYGTVSAITYDSNSNRLTYGAKNYTIASTSNRMTVADGNSITYDNAGNITAIGSDTMSYSKANRLASATVSSVTSTYDYDAFGQRLIATVGGGTPIIQQYGLGGSLLVESADSDMNYAYLYDMPIASIDASGGNVYALHTDNLGTPQKATNSSKSEVWSGAYEPFGEVSPTGSITQNLRFLGQYADASGFHYNYFRDYAPELGRYLESDPIGLIGGLNTYNYASQNPYVYTDRWGLADINITYKNDKGHIAINKYNEIGVYTIGGHGYMPNATMVDNKDINNYVSPGVYGIPISVAELGDRILSNNEANAYSYNIYGPNKPIKLGICYSARGGESSFAAQLQAYLEIKTNAPIIVFGLEGNFVLQETASGDYTPIPAKGQDTIEWKIFD